MAQGCSALSGEGVWEGIDLLVNVFDGKILEGGGVGITVIDGESTAIEKRGNS